MILVIWPVEFGKSCENSPPPFLRMGLDVDTLREFDITHSNYGVTCVLGGRLNHSY